MHKSATWVVWIVVLMAKEAKPEPDWPWEITLFIKWNIWVKTFTSLWLATCWIRKLWKLILFAIVLLRVNRCRLTHLYQPQESIKKAFHESRNRKKILPTAFFCLKTAIVQSYFTEADRLTWPSRLHASVLSSCPCFAKNIYAEISCGLY